MNALLVLLWSSLLMKVTLQGPMRFDPDQAQFFRAGQLRVRCDDRKWNVWRRSSGGEKSCGDSWGSQTIQHCIIKYLEPKDSGQYWCQSEGGDKTESYSISVTDRSVILQAPALPVSTGQTVTLSCKEDRNSTLPARFYRNSALLSGPAARRLTLQPVALSDEGHYECEIEGERSLASLLRVKPATRTSPPVTSPPRPDPLTPVPSPVPSPAPALPAFVFPLVGSVVGVVLLIVLVLVVLLVRRSRCRCRCRKKKGPRQKRRRGRAPPPPGQPHAGQCRHHKPTTTSTKN